MSVTWVQDSKPEIFAHEVEKLKKTLGNGEIQFEGFEFIQYETIIHNMLKYPKDIPDAESKKLTIKSIRNVGKKGEIKAKSILAEANKLTNAYLQLPFKKFVLVTSISIDNPFSQLPIKETTINNSKIVFTNRLAKKYSNEVIKTVKLAKNSIIGEYPSNYMFIQAYTSARNEYEAANNALDAIDLVRGIWNLHINQQSPWRLSFGGIQQPVNNLILGPVHTVHNEKGELANPNLWWYEPQYVGPIKPYNIRKMKNLGGSFLKVKAKLKQHPYKEVIENSIIRYTRALDDRNLNNAFLRLWSVLETLTDTGKESYETTIRRTAFLFKERDIDLQILRILREHRNSSVHLDQENRDIETYLYQLKFYVETLIRYQLWNKFGFRTIQEFAQLLSAPTEENIINSKIQLLTKTKKFLQYK